MIGQSRESEFLDRMKMILIDFKQRELQLPTIEVNVNKLQRVGDSHATHFRCIAQLPCDA
ncbi:hypothetical protein WK70_00475 [Burkholderia cepacia]|nr:hypothetical protein WK70_00475 [Burkholderia cepacia]